MNSIDNKTQFDPDTIGFNEAYYVIWTDPAQQLSMVIRYVLFNGPDPESQVAQVWAWFRDRKRQVDTAFRQVYPLNQAHWDQTRCDLKIGNSSGISDQRAWGRIIADQTDLSWDFTFDPATSIGVDRMIGTSASDLFPRFQSPRCKHRLSGTVVVNGHIYEITDVNATDGHYWNVQNLQTWSWANCVSFQEDKDLVLEAIGFQLFRPDSPVTVCAAFGDSEHLNNTRLPDGVFRNRELVSELEEWQIEADYGDTSIKAKITGNPDDMILIIHPLPDGSALYTTITLTANAETEILQRNGNGMVPKKKLTAQDSVAFEVTKPVRNPRVKREFKIIPAPTSLLSPSVSKASEACMP